MKMKNCSSTIKREQRNGERKEENIVEKEEK